MRFHLHFFPYIRLVTIKTVCCVFGDNIWRKSKKRCGFFFFRKKKKKSPAFVWPCQIILKMDHRIRVNKVRNWYIKLSGIFGNAKFIIYNKMTTNCPRSESFPLFLMKGVLYLNFLCFMFSFCSVFSNPNFTCFPVRLMRHW